MRYSIYMVMMLVVSFLLSPTVASADDNQERVYGRELMTEQERKEERQKMRSMSEDDREQYRAEKHERMKERAKEQNKKLIYILHCIYAKLFFCNFGKVQWIELIPNRGVASHPTVHRFMQ